MKIYNKINKSHFSIFHRLNTDKGKKPLYQIEQEQAQAEKHSIERKSEINKDLLNLEKDKMDLKTDLSLIREAITGGSKIISGNKNELTEREKEILSHLQENYESFLESSSDSEQESLSLLNRMKTLKGYLIGEIKSSRESIKTLKKELETLPDAIHISQSGESSSKRAKYEDDTSHVSQSGESSSKRAKYEGDTAHTSRSEESSLEKTRHEGEQSKKNSQSVNEFLDSLPYNPFDDIGTD